MKLSPAEQDIMIAAYGVVYSIVRLNPTGGMSPVGDAFPTLEEAEVCASRWRRDCPSWVIEVRRSIPL
jgi:hypothetical protein